MPWKQTDPMRQRLEFVALHMSRVFSMVELCERFAVSRKTGYKWLQRFDKDGFDGLSEHSRAPAHCPHRTDPTIEALIVQTRDKHPLWGPVTILDYLRPRHPTISHWPAPSTAGAILKRHNLISAPRRRRKHTHPGVSTLKADAPNDVWTADFKGEFRLGNTTYCYPLTISDACTRYLLGCQGQDSTQSGPTQAHFELAFRTFGLPTVIRTDNGSPFASIALHGLSALNIWWIKLGIVHERIQPAQPQQNGRHERLNRTVKQYTTFPPAYDMTAQQERFDAFCHEYNYVRPHRALGGKTPGSVYQPSPRAFPDHLPEPHYAGHAEIRLVSSVGSIRLHNKQYFLSNTLAGEHLGLEEIDDGIWNVLFYDVLLGRLNEHTKRVYT